MTQFQEDVTKGVEAGFKGSIDAGLTSEQVAQTVETFGAVAESEDLDSSITKLTKSLKHTKILAVIVWILCFVTFIGRFCM